jgi:hypothetical protein
MRHVKVNFGKGFEFAVSGDSFCAAATSKNFLMGWLYESLGVLRFSLNVYDNVY